MGREDCMVRFRNVLVLVRFARACALVALFCFVFCGAPHPAAAQTELQAEVGAAGLPAVDPLADEPNTYRVGYGDVLGVSLWREPEMSVPGAVVRADGKISVPLVKEIYVLGLTVPDLEAELTRRFRRYVNNPVVTVIVREINSRRIFLVGGVGRPGEMLLDAGMTALQAIAKAGGPAEYAKTKKITIVREVAGERVRIPFDYKAVLSGEMEDVKLRSGDMIVIPQ